MAPTWAIVVFIAIVIIVKRARKWLYPGPLSSRPRYEVVPPASLRKLNDDVYEVWSPVERPTVELVFFHGLQREDNLNQAHLSTWSSGGEEPELWLQWLADEFVGARILTVSYDAALRKTDTQGRMDSFQISENLIQNLLHPKAGVGQDGCPVVLVGHSLGCMVIKEVLLKATSEAGIRLRGAKNFVHSVQGIFSYSCPHKGANLPTYRQKGSLSNYLALLNKKVSRLNQKFEALRQKHGWRTAGVTEGYETQMGSFRGFIVEEASARHDLDVPLYTANADHFDVCRPTNKDCSCFQILQEFIQTCLREDCRRQAAPKNLLKYTVGVGDVVESIMHKLNKENPRVAIVGMGGIGKTTVAKVLFDRIETKFDYTCFVDDVKGHAGNANSGEKLQQVIIKNLMWKGRKVEDKRFDWSMLQRKRVLIVLDDVDKEYHMRFMIEEQLLEQSCLVTTSRYRHQFLVQHDFEFHQMGTLDSSDAEKLLCWHALRQKVAAPNIQKWVTLIAQKCGNLPLALEVVGGHLLRRADNEKLWEGAYEKLKEAKPVDGSSEDSLSLILKWSFDALGDDEKYMFLDIATIFHGTDLRDAEEMWDGHLSSAKLTWQNLVDKCYVSLDSFSVQISMHELHREWGRKKANPDPDDVATHTRVFEEGKLRKLLEKEQEGIAVEVLHYSSDWQFPSTLRWDMRRWKKLRVVWDFNWAWWTFAPTEVSEMIFPPSLRCARIKCVGADTLENILGVKSLRCLILRFLVAIQRLPDSLYQLTELKHFGISNNQGVLPSPCLSFREVPNSPGLSALTRLEVLDISRTYLTELPESLGQLSALSLLSIRFCDQLTTLPNSLGQLSALSRLEIKSCEMLTELPETLGKLSALSKLTIDSCELLTQLPESLGKLSALSKLTIKSCERLTELPESLGQLHTLEYLEIRGSGLRKLPKSIGQLLNLEHLYILFCEELEGLPESVGQLRSLKHLTICGSYGMADFSASLGRFCISSLEELNIGWREISNLAFIDQWSALQQLTLRGVRPRELPISVGQSGTSSVKRLRIEKCEQSEIIVLPNSLEYLEIEWCKNLEKLPDSLPNSLEYFKLKWCHKLEKLPDTLGQLSRPLKLVIKSCDELENWRPSSAQVGGSLQELQFKRDCGCNVTFLRQDLLNLATEGRSLREVSVAKGCPHDDSLLSSEGSGEDSDERREWSME